MNTFGQGDFQGPRELPMSLQSGRPQPGIGRGFGRGAPVAAASPARPDAMPLLVSRDSTMGVSSGSVNKSSDPGLMRNAPSGDGFSGGARNEVSYPASSGVTSNFSPPSCMGRGGGGSEGDARAPGYVKFKDALANANQPLREIEEYDKLRASFIPGFHVPGQNFPVLPEKLTKSVNRIEIPDDLIRQYRGGTKNPVSAIEEFLKKLKLDGSIKETAVEDTSMSSFGMFGYTCVIEGKRFPQGKARKKKDAKTEAARNAFDSILRDGFSILKASDGQASNGGGTEAVGGGAGGAGNVAFELKQPVTFGSQNSPPSMFNEFCAKQGLASTITISDERTANGFECEIRIKNQVVALAYATSKKDAKTRACDEALRKLMAEMAPVSEQTHFDNMAALAKAKLVELQRRYAVNFSNCNVLAAFVVMMVPGDKGRVVALATGNGCPKGLELKTDGKVVVDCHAEVLARRALVKWFVKQLSLAADALRQNRSSDDSIFTINENGDKFRLKETVSIHLYISNAPCGDASVFPMTKRTVITPEELELMYSQLHQPTFDLHCGHGCLRVKGDDGQTTAKTLGTTVASRAPALEEESIIDAVKFRTMSCSDKILKWNVLGLQGSIASHLLEPVYLNSLTIGNNFDFGHFTRAVCCRVFDTIRDYLPAGYDLRHPLVGRVSIYETTPNLQSTTAINWSEADNEVEIVSSVTGRTIAESPFHTGADPTASRLCKFGFAFRFRALATLFHQNHLLSLPTYQALKDAASEYNAAKATFYDHLHSSEYGAWRKRAADLDTFRIVS